MMMTGNPALSEPKTKAAFFPRTDQLVGGNPYWRLLQERLVAHGIGLETSHAGFYMEKRWLWSHRKAVDVLHFHFIQSQYGSRSGRASLKGVRRFAENLILARLLGYRVVWTVHDLTPTWPMEPRWIEYLARIVIAQLSTVVIVHCEYARRQVNRRFLRRRGIVTIPHPGLMEAYPNHLARSEARQRLGLDACGAVFLFLGGIHPNKGVDQLIEAFTQLPGQELRLIVAGEPWPPLEYAEELGRRAEQDPRITFLGQFIPDNEIQTFLNAADAVVLPFREILSSGSAMLAMSFGCPLVVPAIGCLPEMVPPGAGVVYEPCDSNGLHQALERCLEEDLSAMRERAKQRSQQFTWDDVGRRTALAYGVPRSRDLLE